MLAALVEEVGELAQALIDCDRGHQTEAQVFAEAIQVACMAVRLAEEGSQEFEYNWGAEHSSEFIAKKLKKLTTTPEPKEST